MSNVISHSHNLFPWYLRLERQQLPFAIFINLLDALSDSLQKHTIGCQCFNALCGNKQIIDFKNILIPFSQLNNGILYIL